MIIAASAQSTATYNGLLFATAATVIPVLFLAIAVQGTLYSRLLQVPDKGMRWLLAHSPIRPESMLAGLIAICVMAPILIVNWFIVLYGIAGELIAIVGLAEQSKSMVAEDLAAFAVILLTVVAGAAPATALAVTFGRLVFAQTWRVLESAGESRQNEQREPEAADTTSADSQPPQPAADRSRQPRPEPSPNQMQQGSRPRRKARRRGRR
jgi:hypothetical protein